MTKSLVLVACGVSLSTLLVLYGQPAEPQQQVSINTAASSPQRALIDQYCVTCHNQRAKAAGLPQGVLTLDDADITRVAEHAEVWESVVRRLRAGMMPPSGARQLDRAERDALTGWLEKELDSNWIRHLPPPGVHRLNRTEYGNVIRDLLDLEIDPTKVLPSDDSTRGFDNIAGALGLSPALLEAYISAAGKISRIAIGNVTAPTQTVYPVPEDTNQNYHVEGLPFGTRGGTLIRHHFPADGEYDIRVFTVKRGNMGGSGAFGGIRGEKLEISVDGERVGLFDWDREVAPARGAGEPGTVDVRIAVKAGTRTLGVTFIATNYAPVNDLNRPFERTTIETGDIGGYTFFPHVAMVRIAGPHNATGAEDTPTRRRIFVCRPAGAGEETACAQEVIASLVERAYRRPPTDVDIATLMNFYEAGRSLGSFDHGIEMVLRRVLADPEFVMRVEREPEDLPYGEPYRIGDLELASRLSFFLWSTKPDQELLNIANEGRLQDPAVLEEQVRRMLVDPKSEALVVNFAGQWLNLRGLQNYAPVTFTYPDFDDNLRQAFRREVELFFESIVREDRNVLDLLTADYTYLNERLARHYQVPNIFGSQFRRVTLGEQFDARRGLLGKGAILTVSSQPGRTSPVKRGEWVLQTLLGVKPPDPPPNVPELPPPAEDLTGNLKEPTMRQKMVDHRVRPDCVQCHKLMDPIGFAMENFDGIGMWRTHDAGAPIDATDVLYDGAEVDGLAGLREWLAGYSDQFVRTLTEKLLTYALGRGTEHYDMPLVRSIVREAAQNDYRFSSIVMGIIDSEQFQMNMKIQQESSVRE